MSAAFGASAYANPTGPSVVSGGATFATSGKTLTVTNTPGAIINWQQFSIQKDEVTRFIQQSAASSVLNRVTTQNPSQILGRLSSNGRVFLINPNGIAFGAGSVVDVAGLVASTLNISDGDWLAGRMRFAGTGTEGKLTHAGTIQTAQGGQVYLVAPNVETQVGSVISAPGGEVLIAAGKTVEFVNAATPDVRVEYSAPEHQAINAGSILAASGSVGIYGTLIRNSGQISASRAEAGDGGRIVLKAAKDLTFEATSRIEANGATGGAITAQAQEGTLLAQGSVEARGEVQKGGEIRLLGTNVGMIGTASVDASGQTGGGTVLVGGDFQGKNADVQNAWRTYVGPEVTIKANATSEGDGGKVIVWADDVTRAYGSISARGGERSGDGGFVEASGKNQLDFAALVDASAPNGRAGTLLLDPTNITVATGGAAGTSDVDAFADPGTTVTISPTTLNNAAATVVLQAADDITIQNAVTLTTAGAGFVAQAGKDIAVNAAVTTRGGNIILEADSPHSPSGSNGVGQVQINAPVSTLGSGATGGSVTLIGGGNSAPGGGFSIKADVTAGTGGIALTLTNTGTLDFGIGAGGNTQLTSKDTDHLLSTGPFVLGQGMTGGSDGLGTGAILLTVNKITNSTSTPIELSSASGSSFTLVAGAGGITLDKPLTTYQDTTITTTGSLTINQTLATSNNDLSIQATGGVTTGTGGSINVGSGSFSCTGTGCGSLNVTSNQIFWDGEAGDFNWFNPVNWRLSGSDPDNVLPDLTREVTIDSSAAFGTINIGGGTAQAKSLVAARPIVLSSGSLEMVNASTFSDLLTLSGGTLMGAGSVTVGGGSGALTWSAGSLTGLGGFLLASGHSGTLSGTLSLDRAFRNDGSLTFTGATLNGTGSLNNAGTLIVSNSSASTVNATLMNKVVDPVTLATTLGTIQVNGTLNVGSTSFPSNDGTINVAGTGTLAAGNASLANAVGASIQVAVGGTLSLGTGTLSNSGSVTIDGTATGGTLANSGTATINGSASVGTLTLAAGTVGGSGSLTATTDFNAAGGALGTGFTDLSLTKVGNFSVGAMQASQSLTLQTTGDGNLTVNGALSASAITVAAGGTGDVILNSGASLTSSAVGGSIVIAGENFVNNVGSGVLSVPSGRWLVYSTNPAGNTFGGLSSGNTPVWGVSYPTGVVVSGNRYVFSDAGAVTATTTSTSKTYGDVADVSGNFTLSGVPINGAATYGNVFNNVTEADVFATGPTVSSAGAAAAATVSGGPYAITATGTANPGYALTFANSGTLSVIPATLAVVADAKSKVYGDADPALTYVASGFKLGDTSGSVLSGGLTRVAGETVAGGPYAINQGTVAANSNYTIAYTGNNLTITPATLAYVANAASREYGDANPAFSGTVTGFKLTDTQGSATTGTLSFTSPATASSNVGSYAINGGGLTANNGNYVFTQAAGNATALTINPAVISLSGTRVYDGTTAFSGATFGGGGVVNGKNGETLSVTGSGNVGSPNVAAGVQPLTLGTLSLANGSGTASNYTFAGGTHTGTINSATLTYVADTASRNAGDPNPPFTGNVTGFVAGETLATATTGTLLFSSPATIGSPEGQYPINGSGLAANSGNYMFVQAPSNATALTILTLANAAAQSAYQTTVNATNNAVPGSTIGYGTGPQDQALGSSQAFLQTGSGETILLTSTPSAQGGVYVNLDTGQQTVITPNETPAPGIYYNEQTSTVVAVAKDDTGKTVVLTGTASSDTVAKGGRPRLVSTVGCR